jgi:molecular chaperone GrpE (heat shock protein)
MARLRQSRSLTDQSQQSEISALETEIRTLHNSTQSEIAQLQEKIKEGNEATIHAQSECSLVKTQLLKIMNAAQRFSRLEFANPSALVDFLLRPPARDPARASPDHVYAKKLRNVQGKLESETKQ